MGAVRMGIWVLIMIASIAQPASKASGAGGMGRLFYSPEERAALDRLRFGLEQLQNSGKDDSASNDRAALQDPACTLQGVVLRSSGKLAIWLNDRFYTEKNLPAGIQVPAWKTRGKAAVEMKGNGGSFIVKPGQTLRPRAGAQGEKK